MQDIDVEIRDLLATIIEKEPDEINPEARFIRKHSSSLLSN